MLAYTRSSYGERVQEKEERHELHVKGLNSIPLSLAFSLSLSLGLGHDQSLGAQRSEDLWTTRSSRLFVKK